MWMMWSLVGFILKASMWPKGAEPALNSPEFSWDRTMQLDHHYGIRREDSLSSKAQQVLRIALRICLDRNLFAGYAPHFQPVMSDRISHCLPRAMPHAIVCNTFYTEGGIY